MPVSFLNEYGTCEYGQAAAFGRKCDKPCHGVKYHECECVSQERARNAMMALKNGLAIGGGIVTGIAAIGLISCLAAQRKSNVFMGAAFGPGTHQQRALVRQYSTNYAGGATATTSAVQMGSMPPPMPVPVAAPMTAVDAQGVPIAAPVAVPVPGQPVGYATPIMPMATATTVSTTTTVAAPYVPTYARPFELAPGRRVRLKGLIKMARLNGTTGCVVGYQPGEENKSDVVVACDADMGRRLALSVENVEMADVQVTTVAAQPMSGALAMTEPPVAFGAAGVVAGALAATYAISVGDRVQIHGLIKCARLNGTQGTVTGMQQNDLLVALDEDNGRVLALDIKCVTRASSPDGQKRGIQFNRSKNLLDSHGVGGESQVNRFT